MDHPQLSHNEFPMGGALVGAGSMVQATPSVAPTPSCPKGMFFWDGILLW
jgi:hypothetical protein